MDHREAGRLGGKARAERLSAERRSEIARMGWDALVKARFGGVRKAAVKWLISQGRLRDYPPATEEQLRELHRKLVLEPDQADAQAVEEPAQDQEEEGELPF